MATAPAAAANPGTSSTRAEARGVLASASADKVIVSFPGTDYQLHLAPERPATTPVGKRILGIIKGQARRIDVVRAGGQFVEPVNGRPRIVQGRVVEVHASPGGPGAITVEAPMPMVLKVGELQRAEQFRPGDMVNTHVLPGASFAPTG